MGKLKRSKPKGFKPQNKGTNFRARGKDQAAKGNYQDAAMLEEKAKEYDKVTFDKSKYPVKKVGKFSHNDPQWYFKSADVLKDVASFSYGRPLGTSVIHSVTNPSSQAISSWNTVPGLMTLTLVPTVGISENAQSALNLGAQNIYTRVRYKNAGAANYDPPDLMLYYIAMSSLYSAWNWMKRIYGYASKYRQMNWYKAPAYAMAESVDLLDIVKNLSNYRAYLNMAADRISAFCVPAVFTYMIRHSWLYSNIYMDSDTTKAQEYMFTPACFYRYDETTSPHGGILTPVDIQLSVERTEKYWTFDKLVQVLESMINALQYSSDIGNMSGDTLKEFGDNLYKLSHFDPDYEVEAVYDKEVLTQFENAVYAPQWYAKTSTTPITVWNIKQDPNTNFIKFKPRFQAGAEALNRGGIYYNFHWDNPTPEDVIVASRINVVDTMDGTSSPTTPWIEYQSCGSEIAIACHVIHFATNADMDVEFTNDTQLKMMKTRLYTIYFGNSGSAVTLDKWKVTAKYTAAAVYLWTAFDWAPPLYSYLALKDTTSYKFKALPDLRDWDVYTFVPNEGIEAMNTLALTSMFNVPN